MAKLPRVTQKIFAGSAPQNQVTKFGTIKAGTPQYSSSAADIMNANFETGWSAAVEGDYAPYRQDRNAVDTAVTQQLGYLFQEGLPEWDASTVYYKNSMVKILDGTNSKIYVSIVDNNTAALNDTTKWVLFVTISNTGVVTVMAQVPNQTAGDNSTKAANTAYVKTAIDNLNGAISSVKTSNLTANRTLVSNSSGKIAVSSTTSTELGYVHGVTSNIQTQLNNKVGVSTNNTFTGTNDFTQSPTMPTPSSSDNSTKGATTAFVKTAVSNAMVFPDYANAYDLTKANGSAPANGWLFILKQGGDFTLNGMSFSLGAAYNIYTQLPYQPRVKAGDTYSSTNWATAIVFKFIPERN